MDYDMVVYYKNGGYTSISANDYSSRYRRNLARIRETLRYYRGRCTYSLEIHRRPCSTSMTICLWVI